MKCEGWKEIKLEEFASFRYGKMPDKTRISSTDGMYPVFSGYRMSGFYDESNCGENELIVVARGVGGTGDVKLTPAKCFLTNLSISVSVDEKAAIKEYLYYHFLLNNLRYLDSGSAQSQITISDLQKVRVSLPCITEQKAIADTLSCLDDKIELNNRMNKTLEEMAQEIFKSWFVDFEPFQDGEFIDSELGPIPKGWRVGTLLDIADYLNGLAMQKFRPSDAETGLPVLKIKELRQGQPDESSELCTPTIEAKYVVEDGDVIFSWSGSLLVDIWCGGTCGLNQHLFKVTSTKYDKWFYYLWTKFHLEKFQAIAKDKATTMGHIKREELKKSLVIIPDRTGYAGMDAQMQPIIDQMIACRLQSRKLTEIRDALLPKLMSGEIRVPLEVE